MFGTSVSMQKWPMFKADLGQSQIRFFGGELPMVFTGRREELRMVSEELRLESQCFDLLVVKLVPPFFLWNSYLWSHPKSSRIS